MDSVPIPGMCISREDIALIVYERFRGMSEEDAHKKVQSLTDEQMNRIADEFAEEFFGVDEGLFADILVRAIKYIEDEEKHNEVN